MPHRTPNDHTFLPPNPHNPNTLASQKIANPPQRRLNGTKKTSSLWKITPGFGCPAHTMLSPDVSSGWTATIDACSVCGISRRVRQIRTLRPLRRPAVCVSVNTKSREVGFSETGFCVRAALGCLWNSKALAPLTAGRPAYFKDRTIIPLLAARMAALCGCR